VTPLEAWLKSGGRRRTLLEPTANPISSHDQHDKQKTPSGGGLRLGHGNQGDVSQKGKRRLTGGCAVGQEVERFRGSVGGESKRSKFPAGKAMGDIGLICRSLTAVKTVFKLEALKSTEKLSWVAEL